MSVRSMSRVWEGSTQQGSALLLLLAIADHADDNGENAFPSIPTLAKKIRMGERQTWRLLGKLEKSGELVVHRRGGGRKRRNIYTVCPPRGPAKPPKENTVKMTPFPPQNPVAQGENPVIRGQYPDTASAREPSKEPSKESSTAKISKLKPPDRVTDNKAWQEYWRRYYDETPEGARPLSRDAAEAERREARALAITKRQKRTRKGPDRAATGLRPIGEELAKKRGA